MAVKPKLKNEELIRLARNGDEDAYVQLLEWNTRLCYHIGQRYLNIAELDDLVSLGKIALIKAYNTFDLDKGILFATYASRLIVNEILMYERKNKRHKGNISMEQSLNMDFDGNELRIEDVLCEEEPLFKTEDFQHLNQALEILKSKHVKRYEMIHSRFFEGKNQLEVAEELGISQSYVSRLTRSAIKELKKISNSLLEEKGAIEMPKEIKQEVQNLFYLFTKYPDLKVKEIMDASGYEMTFVENVKYRFRKGTLKGNLEKVEKSFVEKLENYLMNVQKPKEDEIVFIPPTSPTNLSNEAKLAFSNEKKLKINNQVSSVSNKLETISLLSSIIQIISAQPNEAIVDIKIDYKVLE